jgi:DNA polymerase-1
LEQACKTKFLVAHHAKFELQWLYKNGVEPGSVLVFDTMLAEYVIQGNRRVPLDLDSTCRRYGIEGKESIVKYWIEQGIGPEMIPIRRLREYCEQDVDITHKLFLKQREKLQELGLLPVFFTRCLTTLVLADIEAKGMCLDKSEVIKEFRSELEKSRSLLTALAELTGGINPKSPKQVGEYLYDRLGFEELKDWRGETVKTDGGARKTDEDTVSRLSPRTEEQRRFIDLFRSYIPIKKRLETLTKLHDCLEQSGGILYANYNQAVTATHRLSSNGRKHKVQFQNIDRDFKKLFKPRIKGWQIGDADAPQLEFRVAAYEGKDKVALKDIREHFDVHLYTASIINKKSLEEVTKKQRTEAKPHTFKPVFGGKSGTPDERRYYKAFQKKYHALYAEQTRWTYEVAKNKQLRASSGLIFYWPDCEMKSDGYVTRTTEIFNYKIQSFATADIIPITLAYLWYRLRGAESCLTKKLHDNIVGEIHPDENKLWEKAVKQAFTTDVFNYLWRVYGVKFNVPLGVSYNLGPRWGMGEETLYEVDPQADHV